MLLLTDPRAALAFALFATVSIGCGQSADSIQKAESTSSVAQSAQPAQLATDTQPSSPAAPTSFSSLRAAFQHENQRLDSIKVLEVRSVGAPGSVILAHAVRADHRYSGDMRDEMFGLFHALPGADTVLRPIALIRTPSWLDYFPRIERIDPDSIVLLGKTSYTEDVRVIRWSATDIAPYVRPEDPWQDETVAFTDTFAISLFDEPGGNQVPFNLRYRGHLDYLMRVLEVRDNWFKVAVWSPQESGCDDTRPRPTVDTLWTPFQDANGRRLLRRDSGGMC
jgi:hypothetical protein